MADTAVREQQPTIFFDDLLKEAQLPQKGMKQLVRKLKQTCLVDVNKEQLSIDRLASCAVYVIAAPQMAPTASDVEALRQYIFGGGSLLLLLGDGAGGRYAKEWNGFLKEFGIEANEDCVVRTVLHKYFHPKEVCITNGVTNREFNRVAGKVVDRSGFGATQTFSGTGSGSGSPDFNSTTAAQGAAAAAQGSVNQHMCFVYPHGLTLNVQRPAVPVLTSGFMAYPLNRPIAAVYEHPGTVEGRPPNERGRLMVIGSALPFADQWIPKEENDKLTHVVFEYLLHRVKLNQIDADDPDVTDYHYLPDTASLADRLRVAVEESEELPRDFTQLFDTKLFSFDTDLIPEVIATHQLLSIKHEPLSLIHPEFQAPLPPRLPATFEPTHRELPPPALDLFDLDDHFASEKIRLSQLTNKCQNSQDLPFFIHESAEIMGVTKKLRSPRNKDPRALLDYVFRQVVQWKKGDGSPSPAGGAVAAGGGAGAGGGGGARHTFRIFGAEGADCTPWERNAPWTMTLNVDFAANTVAGRLSLDGNSPAFQAQQAGVRGAVTGPDQLQFTLELTNVLGETVAYAYTGMLQRQEATGQTQMVGQVQWGGGSGASYCYLVEVDSA